MSAVKRLLSAFTAAVAIASVCASCAENESEFTVPHLVETVESVTESSGAEEPVTTESSSA